MMFSLLQNSGRANCEIVLLGVNLAAASRPRKISSAGSACGSGSGKTPETRWRKSGLLRAMTYTMRAAIATQKIMKNPHITSPPLCPRHGQGLSVRAACGPVRFL